MTAGQTPTYTVMGKITMEYYISWTKGGYGCTAHLSRWAWTSPSTSRWAAQNPFNTIRGAKTIESLLGNERRLTSRPAVKGGALTNTNKYQTNRAEEYSRELNIWDIKLRWNPTHVKLSLFTCSSNRWINKISRWQLVHWVTQHRRTLRQLVVFFYMDNV